MAGFGVELDVTGAPRARRRILEIAHRAADARPAFLNISKRLMDDADRRFATQGGGTWRPLSRQTVARKQREGHRPRILEASGALRASYTRRGAPGQELEIRRERMTFGTEIFYGRFHKDRPVLKDSASRRRMIIGEIREHLLSS